MERLLAYSYLGKGVWKLGHERYHQYRTATSFTVTLMGDDDIYGELQQWLVNFLPPGRQRSLMLSSLNARGDSNEDSPEGVGGYAEPKVNKAEKVRLQYDGTRAQTVTIDGHKINVVVLVPEFRTSTPIDSHTTRRSQRICLTARTLEGRDVIVRLCEELVEKKRKESLQPRIYCPSQWGSDWTNRQDLGQRSIKSVILKQGQTERLIDDLTMFLAAEDRYLRFSLPYHRGYMFHGPPGTGKTSIAKALANHFGLDLYVLSPTELKKDSSLSALIGGIKSRSILLLEDLDAFHAATSREDYGGVTMSGLLNALDGVSTPHGLITMMTTNNLAALDGAITRAGRVDISEEITQVNIDQVERLYRFFYDHQLPGPFQPSPLLTPAEVVEVFKRNMDDAGAAFKALESLECMPIGTP